MKKIAWHLAILIVVFGLLVNVERANAFNRKRCDQFTDGFATGGAVGAGIMSTVSSVTSYVSSTGPCRAIGERESERLNFVVVNHDALEKDAARGSGENLSTLASLYDIPKPQGPDFGKYIQQNFKAIFGDIANKDPEQVFDDLENKVALFKTGVTL